MEPNNTMGESGVPAPEKEKKSYGVLVALVIIVAMIVAGAFYLFQQRVGENALRATDDTALIDTLGAQSDSTEASAIEADLAATSADEFDKELDEAFVDLEASLESQ